ncbi:MAG: SDR family oxidoreductase [Bacteroidales bacterium]|nr:SDR family oxidoreductase [Bacteroidales bacterium]
MDLKIKDKLFVVTGASSGLGNGVARALLREGARLIAVARNEEKLKEFQQSNPDLIETLTSDVIRSNDHDRILRQVGNRFLSGVLINAGGPPAMSFIETQLADWDTAYQNVLRWKVSLTKMLLPIFVKQQYGRIVYIESAAVKQPIKNLVLSNSLRLGVVGFVKTLSQEIADKGITLNIMAPGFHETPAAERLYVKRSENENISLDEARKKYESEINVGRMGDALEFGTLGAWLLSPLSGYITGQTISVDGGTIKGIMG